MLVLFERHTPGPQHSVGSVCQAADVIYLAAGEAPGDASAAGGKCRGAQECVASVAG